jgi:uncharacterized protein
LNDAYVNVIKTQGQVLVAVCDENLLGKTLMEGKIRFEVKDSFYKGNKMNIDRALELVGKSTIANLIGQEIVEKAIEAGLVHPQAILKISGVPHAQIVRL